MAKRTANGLNEIRKLINVEEKYLDVAGNPTFDSSGQVTYLTGLAQGDGISDREGNSLKVQNFSLNYFVTYDSATSPVCFRILLVRDLQNTGATITASDVMETVGVTSAPVTFADYVNGPLSNKRFSIVYDQVGTVDQYNPISAHMFKSNHDCHVAYRGTTSAVASAGNGSYFLIAISNAVGAVLPRIQFQTRMVFTDN